MNYLLTNQSLDSKILDKKIKVNTYFNLYTDQQPHVVNNSSKKIFILGKIFGYYNKLKFVNSSAKKIPKKLFNQNNIKNHIDGNYCFFNSENNIISIQIDIRGISDVFYLKEGKKIFFSNNLLLLKKLSQKKLNLDNFAILSAISSTGKRPPLNHTFFEEIKRISFDQVILVDKKNIKIKTQKYTPLKQKDPKSEKLFLEDYNKYLKGYSNIGHKRNKVIFMSSGWDSLTILKLLTDKFGRNKVKPIIARLKFSKKTKVFNRFEIKKAQKICKHFKIKLNYVDVNYSKIDKYLKDLDKLSTKRMLTNTFAYFLHYNLVKEGVRKFGSSDFFSGEISDGAHNFGFSQYSTLFDNENNGYREYMDKMMSYLFGPTFFEKIKKKTFHNDSIFKFLKEKKKINTKINIKGNSDIFKNIMQSMFVTSSRFPLDNLVSEFLMPNKKDAYLNEFNRTYLNNINFSTSEQLYSSYIYLYNKFHWQGSTVRTGYHIVDEFNSNFVNIFWDKNVQRLLSSMPEHYGRGLELKPTKFPEKYLLKQSIDTDKLNIGPHSYISDNSNFNPYFEVIYNSPFRAIIKKTFKEYNPLRILDKKYFNHKFIKKAISSFNKKSNKVNAEKIYSLFCICKFFKDINY